MKPNSLFTFSNSFRQVAVTAAAISLSLVASAFASSDHDKHQSKQSVSGKAADSRTGLTDAEVRKVDKEAKKITLKHGEIKNLEMPAMTMVFQVNDAAFLDVAKAGDKIKFKAEKISGGYAVTAIEVSK